MPKAGQITPIPLLIVLLLANGSLSAIHTRSPYPPEPADPTAAPTMECPELEVAIDSGKLRGACRPAMQGRPRYAAFMHVPYARPPIGDLRFKSPRPVEPWDDVRNATALGPKCVQGSGGAGLTDEDCLHVNVYSAWLHEPAEQQGKQKDLVPVMLHVHGGGNTMGSGNQILPDYFVASGLVVVTFNYRLGGYDDLSYLINSEEDRKSFFQSMAAVTSLYEKGFLNLDDDDVPGNVAFKDMVAAMQWVHRNVHNFGGDPNRVTINGCSSAAEAVHWLTLLPVTEGLFRAAIIKSGSALGPGSYSEHGPDFAEQVLAFLRKWVPDADDDVQRLQKANAFQLDLAFQYAGSHMRPTGAASSTSICPERRSNSTEPKLIERSPESYVLNRSRTAVPLMIGRTACEFDMIGTLSFMMDENPDVSSPAFEGYIPPNIVPLEDARLALGLDTNYTHHLVDAAADFRAKLFNLSYGDTQCDLMCRWQDYKSGTMTSVGTVRAARMHARKMEQHVYAYNFDYPVTGSCPSHAQDDHMVWPEIGEELIDLREKNPRVLSTRRQITMFSNFVKFLNPVPQTDGELLTTEWPPMNKDGPDVYLSIGENLTLKLDDLLGRFGPFWSDLYAKFRDGKGV